ncbi:hypothetical protein [Xanthomonas citri]|uniref:hypothetical protein n=1 Tax=Xanthomonas citri TaxID=346 RepID=UPI001F1E75FD|nr:hypothetical protein [Xanthomonas citri]
MKKIYVLSAATLVSACLLMFLFFRPAWDMASSPAAAASVKNAKSLSDKSALNGNRSTATHQSQSWASMSAAEINRTFHDTKNRAEAGDPAAQRQLAEMYERCSIYSISRENFAGTLDQFAKLKKENAVRYDSIKKRVSHYCNEIDGGNLIPTSAYELWYAEAAKRGDIIAKLKIASGAAMRPEAYKGLVEETLKSKDPEAIFAVDEMLASSKGSSELGDYGPDEGGNYSEFAWAVAGCRAGADCGPGSYRMDLMCINFGVCDASNYEDAIRKNFVPTGQLKVLDKNVERIQSIIKN